MSNKPILIKYKSGKGKQTERLVEDLQVSFEMYNNIEQWVLRCLDCKLNYYIILPLKGVTFPL
jgi:formate-dependent nitrite reductase cytochrome c552 subunit